ncbi:MAG: DUF3040 domain-containing protein [Acidimicrobiales bacterium]
MPLSEHEQRILAELEESLVRHDPRFAARVRSDTLYRRAGRNCRWAVVGFIAGLAILVAFYSQSVPAGLFGVALMFLSAVAFERNFRHLGKLGWRDLARAKRREPQPDGAEHALGGAREWLRSRLFRRNR